MSPAWSFAHQKNFVFLAPPLIHASHTLSLPKPNALGLWDTASTSPASDAASRDRCDNCCRARPRRPIESAATKQIKRATRRLNETVGYDHGHSWGRSFLGTEELWRALNTSRTKLRLTCSPKKASLEFVRDGGQYQQSVCFQCYAAPCWWRGDSRFPAI